MLGDAGILDPKENDIGIGDEEEEDVKIGDRKEEDEANGKEDAIMYDNEGEIEKQLSKIKGCLQHHDHHTEIFMI